jgi:hypothetical protein
MVDFSNKRISKINDPRGTYIYVDLKDLNDSQVLDVLIDLQCIIQEYEFGSLLIYADFTNVKISAAILPNIRSVAKSNQKYIKRSAVTGTPAFARALFTVYKKIIKTKMVFFETKTEALDYLFS